jgi:CheY-like chemotaxis protein/HPt (histidine-containing phosphotransfer) domain-containing protein
VLLVEDNEVNRLVAGDYLAQFGYQVDVARDGVEAVEAVQRREYVAVIMDCQMPIMDGYEATREIRRREAPGKRLPIIALTAHALIGEREKVLAAGMDDYLTKPVDPVALRNALAQATAARAEAGNVAGREFEASTSDASVSRTSGAPLSSEADLDAKVERFTELCELFLAIIPDQIDELERAITAGEADEVSERAHKLKSGTLTIGARRMASVAAEIEGRALLGRLSEAPKQLAELRQRFLVVSAQVRDEIAHDCQLPGVNGVDDGESKAP